MRPSTEIDLGAEARGEHFPAQVAGQPGHRQRHVSRRPGDVQTGRLGQPGDEFGEVDLVRLDERDEDPHGVVGTAGVRGEPHPDRDHGDTASKTTHGVRPVENPVASLIVSETTRYREAAAFRKAT